MGSTALPVPEVLAGAATDTGRVRRVNEDALLQAHPVYLVADGMGGHAAGDLASAIVVEEFALLTGEGLVAEDVHAALSRAAVRVRALPQRGAGTTVAAAVLLTRDGLPYWLVLNLGDSRVYRLDTAARLVQVSVDHSLVQEMVDSGDLSAAEARQHPERNVVTRAVGASSPDEADYWLLPVEPGERLLICSDGLTTELEHAVIEQVLRAAVGPQEAATQLVELALAAGGRDNVTAIVVEVESAVGDPEQTTPRAVASHASEDTVRRAVQR